MQKSHHGSLDPQLRRHEQVQGHSNQGSASSKETVFFPPRQLPDRGINDEKLDDAYVAFILYCNPTVPLTTDTSELRETFRSPPKSDGKTFSPFVLFELIQKLDNKDLKTWAQLAIELGVEPPDLGKGQSTQKIQQYAVRLKVSILLVLVTITNYYASVGCMLCMLIPSLSTCSGSSILTGLIYQILVAGV